MCVAALGTLFFAKHTASCSWTVQPKVKYRQPDKGQNVSIQDMLENSGLGWAESQPPGLLPLAGCGAMPGNGAHPQFHNEVLGKVRRISPLMVCG